MPDLYNGGWGPAHETFSGSSPASHAVLNSMTDNPAIVDERNFVRLRAAGVGTYRDFLRVKPGDQIELSIYFSNNAADNLV